MRTLRRERRTRRGVARAAAALTAAIGFGAFASPSAEASTVRVQDGQLIFEAAAGETNVVEVDLGNFTFVGVRDSPNGGPAAGPGCFPGSNNFVVCSAINVRIDTGDRNDRVIPFTGFLGAFPRPFDVDLGAGDDEATAPRGAGFAHIIRGGAGVDRLTGSTGDDTLRGEAGSDRLRMSDGNDRLSGGTSFDAGGFVEPDVVEAPSPSNGVTMIIGQGPIDGDIETLFGSGGPDRLVGDGDANGLDGLGGDDDITGGAGRDSLTGGFGDDTVRALDGEADSVDCGAGEDTAVVDDVDGNPFSVGGPLDCETVVTAGAIDIVGGPEASTLEIRVDSTPPGFTYTVTDTAPLEVVDARCQAGPPIVCTSPVEVPVTLDLGGGDDTLTLGGNHPFAGLTVDGGAGNDTLVASPVARGGPDIDTITAGNCPSAGECLLVGGPGDDVLEGGNAADRLRGGTGSDTITGGDEPDPLVDTADYADFTAGVEADIGGPSVEPAPEFGEDEIGADVENLAGGEGEDVLTGDGNANRLEGGGGNDELLGMDGDDRLLGGAGRDLLLGGLGGDILDGGDDADTADYSDFAERVVIQVPGSSSEPDGASDSIGGDVENATGGDGDDDLTGGDGVNTLAGGPGEDTLRGEGGDDRLDGGADDDTLEGGEADEGQDEFFGGPGRDTLTYEGEPAAVVAEIGGIARIGAELVADTVAVDMERLIGGSGPDVLSGGPNRDDLVGNEGDDMLRGGPLGDDLDGGDGFDTANYDERLAAVTVTTGDDIANDGDAAAGEGDLADVENVVGGAGNDLLVGDEGDNRLEGGGGTDTLRGGDGQDELLGGDDNDLLEGGEEFDKLQGGSDSDVLLGEGGADALQGGPGTDTLDGGTEADSIDGGPDRDEVLYSDRTNGVNVDPEPRGPSLEADDGEPGESDVVIDTVEDIVGGEGHDVLTGTAGENELRGNEGNDILSGGAGNDRLVGGDDLIDGEDILSGGEGDDELLGGDDQDELSGGTGVDTLAGGPAFDKLEGGAGADVLLGEDGADALHGDAGDDSLDGGADSDLLDGGADVDTLLYASRTQDLQVDPEPGGPLAPADDGESGEADVVFDTVENITGGSGDDVLTGTGDANTLLGNVGRDILNGLGGADVLDGGFDQDTLLSQDGVRDEDFCGPSFDSVAADLVDNVSLDCEVVTFPVSPPPPPAPPGVNTPPGTNVVVTPAGAPATVTFSSVTVPGQTSAVTSSTGPAVPSGFQTGSPPRFYDITTTAVFTPPVTVCVNTTGVTFPGGQPRLFHFENGAWRDVTTSVSPPDVCGVVSSFSPFAVFARKRTVKAVRCVVPNVKGKTLSAARRAIARANCSTGRVRGKGRVRAQWPRPGRRLRKGARVDLVLRRAPRR